MISRNFDTDIILAEYLLMTANQSDDKSRSMSRFYLLTKTPRYFFIKYIILSVLFQTESSM